MDAYEFCAVMGTGQFVFNCARELAKSFRVDAVWEYENYAGSQLERLCTQSGFPYTQLATKDACIDALQALAATGKRTLLVSASNLFLLPGYITDNPNIRAINYHPGLLSRHRGRNAEAWAIYSQDNTAGVTWHDVTSSVDDGKILASAEIPIDGMMTSLKLMIRQYALGFELFKQVLADMAAGREPPTPAEPAAGTLHYSHQKPNNGMLDFSWDFDRMSAFLRSMDYGALAVLGKPFALHDGKIYTWDRYIITQNAADAQRTDADKLIAADKGYIMLTNYFGKEIDRGGYSLAVFCPVCPIAA